MEVKNDDITWSDVYKFSSEETECEPRIQQPTISIDDEDDFITEQFQQTVMKRGSIKMDRRQTLSPRSRSQRRRVSPHPQEGNTKANDNFISKLNKLRVNQTKESKTNTIAMNTEHAKVLSMASDRMKTQIPFSLEIDIREEAYAIVQSTAQAYKNLLGKKHKLTIEAYEYLSSM